MFTLVHFHLLVMSHTPAMHVIGVYFRSSPDKRTGKKTSGQ